MRNQGKRIEFLEARQPKAIGRWHRVIQDVGQSEGQAIDAYGADRIGPNDCVMLRVIVEPKARMV